MPAAPPPFRIVLNYRRDDTSGHAGRLYDALAARFGRNHVFMDIDAIEPGVDFRKVIDGAVESCDAFISLIGRDWLTAADSQGRRRLDNPGDFVRIEIETALDRDVRLIPVLVQDAGMPTKDQLPEPLAKLAFRNALEIRDSSWGYDVDRLVRTLEQVRDEKTKAVGDGRPPPPPDKPRLRIPLIPMAVAVAIVAVAILLGVLLTRDDPEPDASEPPTTTGSPPTTGSGGRIAYGAQGDLFAIDAGGGNRVRLTSGATNSGAPDWSQDGMIAFARNEDIWVMDAEGGAERPLTKGPARDNAPAWSSDGERLTFDRAPAGVASFDIWVMDADGSGQTNLTKRPGEGGGAPDWSPDGGRIVYQMRGSLLVMNGDGSGKRDLTAGLPGTALSPAWSPDGTLIAFALYPGGPDEPSSIYVIRPDGTDARRLTRAELYRANAPAWSTDGDRLVFTADDGLWVVHRDGSGLAKIEEGTGLGSPSWGAPD